MAARAFFAAVLVLATALSGCQGGIADGEDEVVQTGDESSTEGKTSGSREEPAGTTEPPQLSREGAFFSVVLRTNEGHAASFGVTQWETIPLNDAVETMPEYWRQCSEGPEPGVSILGARTSAVLVVPIAIGLTDHEESLAGDGSGFPSQWVVTVEDHDATAELRVSTSPIMFDTAACDSNLEAVVSSERNSDVIGGFLYQFEPTPNDPSMSIVGAEFEISVGFAPSDLGPMSPLQRDDAEIVEVNTRDSQCEISSSDVFTWTCRVTGTTALEYRP